LIEFHPEKVDLDKSNSFDAITVRIPDRDRRFNGLRKN
jgi:hypothetical protein